MSKQQQQQLSYICKDQQNQKGQGQSHRRMNTNQNNFDDKNVQNQKKQNKYNRRSNSQEKQQNSHNQPSQPVLARAQINQPQNKIYDSHSLILAYQELLEPPQELEEFIGKIPHLFTKISQKPLISPSTQFTHSDEDDPKWMHSNETFQIIDIENEIEKKRIEYQKSHGTFEKKQEQKSKKQNEINQEEISELQQAKEKYRQLREQEEKQLQVASETKAKLQELFSFSEQEQPKLNNSINTKVLSVEEVEKQALAFSNNKQKDLIKVEQPQEKIESYFSNFNNNQTDDFFEQLEEMGIHIQRQTQVQSYFIKILYLHNLQLKFQGKKLKLLLFPFKPNCIHDLQKNLCGIMLIILERFKEDLQQNIWINGLSINIQKQNQIFLGKLLVNGLHQNNIQLIQIKLKKNYWIQKVLWIR